MRSSAFRGGGVLICAKFFKALVQLIMDLNPVHTFDTDTDTNPEIDLSYISPG